MEGCGAVGAGRVAEARAGAALGAGLCAGAGPTDGVAPVGRSAADVGTHGAGAAAGAGSESQRRLLERGDV